MTWTHIDILQDNVSPPKKECVENHVSGDEPETKKKVTYTQILTGSRIGSAD